MAILILATNHLNERKHGLYPTIVGYHDQLGLKCFLHLIGNPETLGPYAKTGARLLLKGKSPGMMIPKIDIFLFASLRFRDDLTRIRRHIAQAGKPEIIVALTSSPIAGTVAYLAAREHRIPFVIWEHLTHYQRNILRGLRLKRRIEILNAARKVLAVSEPLSSSLKSTIGFSDKIVGIMPNPIPSDFLVKLKPVSKKYEEKAGDSFAFGAWTNWRKIKRLDLLLEAFALAYYKCPDIKLLIAGPVTKKVYHKINPTLIHQPGLIWLDSIPRNEIRDLARVVDCCVIPSDHETFGLPALEAMAMGRPVITTRCGGPEHLVTQSNGVVVEKGSSRALADAMIEMRLSHKKYIKSEIAHSTWMNYGPEAIQLRWQSFYESLGVIATEKTTPKIYEKLFDPR